MNLAIKKDEESGEFYIDFDEIKHMFEDPSLVYYYSIEPSDGRSFAISFFDSNNNPIYFKRDV
jgi:hypothetical protein